jgi:hypothetical protein
VKHGPVNEPIGDGTDDGGTGAAGQVNENRNMSSGSAHVAVSEAHAERCTPNHESYRIVPEYRAVLLDGGDIKRVMFVDWKDERLSTWKPGHNITFCPDENKMINTTINSIATLLSKLATTTNRFLSATRLIAR